MIFISYRREDTKAEVTNLYRRLEEHFGEEHVFVDYNGIPPGQKWTDDIRQKLEKSCVLLAVIGSAWGDAQFTDGDDIGRFRLDDKDDWVRQEICLAISRGTEKILVIPVLIDDTVLPKRKWYCELDQLPYLEHRRIRNQEDFERDFTNLCGWLEKHVPELERAAESRRKATPADLSKQALQQYLAAELRNHAAIQLPLISHTGQLVVAPINELRIDLPFIISHKHAPINPRTDSSEEGRDLLSTHDQFRNNHTNALLVDRAARLEDFRRDCDIGEKLGPGSRLVVVGDPGCGKSTLLQWIAYHYAAMFEGGLQTQNVSAVNTQPLPVQHWLPVLILCRDMAEHSLPTQLEDLFRIHLKRRQFSDATISVLIPHFERLLDQGQACLLVDGIDEIPSSEQRLVFCRLLTSIANRFPNSPIVITSRVVGFQAVRDELALKYDHLLVAPLDRAAKQAFIERWSRFIGWGEAGAARLIQQVCHNRVTARLTDNIFLLALVAQIQVLDHKLPSRRVDVYRRAVELMIQRRRPFPGPPLKLNELIPHLEFMAYWMRKKGAQRCSEVEVTNAFRELRRQEPDEPILQTRPPEDLLQACIDSLGLLNVAGTEMDRRGFERHLIQFFHQSFQEYFAGQAINHGHDGEGKTDAVERLRDLLATIEIREREVNIWGKYNIVEPVIAGQWQEAVRLAIADQKQGEADKAILMLLPDSSTPAREARARAVFALQCMADEPPLSEQTASVVFDAAIHGLEENDGINTALHTWMDEAFAAVYQSAFGNSFRDRLLESFIHSYGDQRMRIGRCLALRSVDTSNVTPENADAMIAAAIHGLASNRQSERVRVALELMNRFYISKGEMFFLTPSQREALLESLLSASSKDEATECAVMWALCWLTGARNRVRGNRLSEPSKTKPTDKFLLLDAAIIRKVEAILKRPYLDTNTLGFACLSLTREEGLDLVVHQLDWTYELARIADGVVMRRHLLNPRPTGRLDSVAWIKNLLNADLPLNRSGQIAVTLGSFGVFVPEMTRPLRDIFTSERYMEDDRDEALIYLGLIGTSEAASILIEAADTPPTDKDDYVYTRGLFGLLLLDNVDVLAEQISKALPHSDLNAYAYGLAGSHDPRGLLLLKQLKKHPNKRIRAAAKKGLAQF